MSANSPGQISPDGQYYWDGRQWVSTLSPDGSHRWNGTAWAPLAPGPAPPPPPGDFASGPPSGPPTTPAPAWLRMEAPGSVPASPSMPPPPAGFVPPSGYSAPTRAARPSGIAFQFGGSAAWSIAFGLAAILAPIFSTFYFPILPIFGLWRAYIALRAGRTGGAILGFVLNILGGIVSLFASGLVQPR